MAAPRFSAAPTRGFTLIELLVAISIMALMAILGWRGLDGMSRAQVATQARADEVLTLQAGLGQWSADLDALVQIPQTQSLDWDGRALRITRRSSQPNDPGPLVVAWSRRTTGGGSGVWLRWQSPPLVNRGDWQQAWARAGAWAQNPGDAERRDEVSILPLDGWQLFYFRSNAWTNPLSSGDNAAGAAGTAGAAGAAGAATLPDGVRLVLDVPAGHALTGRITHDWVRPTVGGGKS